MALVNTTVVALDVSGNRRVVVVDVALDNSYTTGGYVLSPQTFGLGRVDYGDVNLKTTVAAVGPGTGFLDCSNPAAPKLKFQSAGHVGELAAGAAIVGAIAEIRMYGE